MTAKMWDQRYGADGFAYGTDANDFLREVATELPLGPALCLGAGEGRNAVFLAGRPGAGAVTAVDSSKVGLAKASQLAAREGVPLTTVEADLRDFAFDQQWSVITSIFVHLPPDVRGAVHRSVVDALSPDGMFVLEWYSPSQLGKGTGGPPIEDLLLPLDAAQRELDGLELVIARELDREVHEGRFHTGWASVVQILARKSAS